MSLTQNIQQGMRSLALHQMRTLLSTLGILFGVVAVVTMLSIGEGAKQETLAQIEQLGMNTITIRQNKMGEEQMSKAREQRSFGLTQSDAEAIKKNVPYIQYLASLKVIETAISTTMASLSPEVLAITEEYDEIKNLELAEGRFLGSLDMLQRKHVCVLGCEVSKSLGKHGRVGQSIRMDNVEFQIVGILKNKNWKAAKSTSLTTRNLNKSIFIPLGAEISLPKGKQGDEKDLCPKLSYKFHRAVKCHKSSASSNTSWKRRIEISMTIRLSFLKSSSTKPIARNIPSTLF